jgi:hypothetical protein
VITTFDDFPIHSSALPVAHTVSSDPNHYDRYWFNGFTRDGSLFFAGAMGHYPVRNDVDAAFSVVKDGVEHSLFSSGRMPADRSTVCGPLRVEVLEPLKTIRLVADVTDGLGCSLTFRHRSIPVEEPRQSRLSDDGVVLTDHTRLTQWGTWEGTIYLHGEEIHIDPAQTWAMRDRSWGVRPVGDQVAQNRDVKLPQIFWLWAPMHFDDRALHVALHEETDGRRWLQTAHFVPVSDGVELPDGELDTSFTLDWKPGTRQARSATLYLEDRKHNRWQLDLVTLYTFYMRGIGYWHPKWLHGSNHGLLETAREDIKLADFDPMDLASMHIQNVVRGRLSGPGIDDVEGIEGIGVLEQVALGDHEPTGLHGFFEPVTV